MFSLVKGAKLLDINIQLYQTRLLWSNNTSPAE